MPRLTESVFVLAILLPSSDVALAADKLPDPQKQSLSVRANGPVSDEYLEAFMALVDSKKLPRENYPDLNQLSAKQIISVLCGSFKPAYWKKLQESNSSIGIPTDPNAVIGDAAYELNWPACIFVDTKPSFKYTVKAGDTAYNIYKSLTGTPGESQVVDKYFQTSGISNLDNIKPGQTLVPDHITFPTVVKASFTSDKLKSKLSNYQTSTAVKISLDHALLPDTPADNTAKLPRFEIAAGKIQSALSSTYESPVECSDPSASSEPFNSRWLANAYKDSLEAIRLLNMDQSFTKVTIADNGFFGANIVSGNLVFGAHFPSRFFMNRLTGGAGFIGPMTTSDKKIYPINYLNGKRDASVVSGHGTHIAGLVLGAALFSLTFLYLIVRVAVHGCAFG